MSLEPPLQQYWEPPLDEERTAALWARLAARRRAPDRRAGRRVILAAACAAALCAGLALALWPSGDRAAALASRDPAISVAPGTTWTAATGPVVLDDDSRIDLAAAARLQLLANDGTRFATLLQAGRARFDVRPGGPRRWEVETALATVEVVGTAFTVSLHDQQLEVDVDRGVVLVHGEQVPGRMVRLTAGDHLVVGTPTPVTSLPPIATPPPVAAPAPVAPRRPPAPAPVAPAPAPAPLAEIIEAADRLSSQGDPAGAARLLEGARHRADDPAAGLVVFTLGRLYLDALDKPALAAAAFDEVIARRNPRGLLEDAYARRVEAWVRAGRHDRAADALAAFAAAYPDGRRLAAARELVGAP